MSRRFEVGGLRSEVRGPNSNVHPSHQLPPDSGIVAIQPSNKHLTVPAPSSWPPGVEGAALMAKSLNKVMLIGNLGKDPEVKYTPSGTPVAKLALATNERFKDKDGQWADRTEWHNIVLWQRLAEIAGEYLKKGSKVYIEGRIRTDSWDDKQTGQKKYMTNIIGNDIVLLGGRGEGGGEQGARGVSSGNNFDQRTPEPEHATASASGSPITDEDIPF